MARSIWSGSISFGLVNIPVKMYTAVQEQTVSFHLLHDQDNVRLQRKMVCPADGQEVHAEHTVKGYEIAPDQYVKIQPSELEAVAPESSRMIEIRDFVGLETIDPIYFDRPYYLEPEERAGKAYKLLVEAMGRTRKVGIAKFVMRGKEYLAALRAVEGVICLETMHFDAEVTAPGKLPGIPPKTEVNQRELKAAEQLIESLAKAFDPADYQDEYRQRVLDLIEKKAKGQKIVAQAPLLQKSADAGDLMSALQASLAQAKKKKAPAEAKRRKTA